VATPPIRGDFPGWMDLTPTQDSNGGLPDISELLTTGKTAATSKRKPSCVELSDDEPDADDVVRRPVASKRRRVLADSEDDTE
jgi:ATP-dependent DNA helicase MPH1